MLKKNLKFGVCIVIGIITFSLVLALPIMAQTPTDVSTGLETVEGAGGLGSGSLVDVVRTGISIFLGILGVVAVLLILYGGFLIMSAQGEAEKVENGRRLLIQAVAGLVVVLAAFAIASFVINMLVGATGGTTGGGTGPGSGPGPGPVPGFFCDDPVPVSDAPYICGINPDSARNEEVISIDGGKFGEYVEGVSKVFFIDQSNQEFEAEVATCGGTGSPAWYDDSVRVIIPNTMLYIEDDANLYTVKVINGENSLSNYDDSKQDIQDGLGDPTNEFTLEEGAVRPSVICMIPDSGKEGSSVEVWGKSFGVNQGSFTFYDNISAITTLWSDEQINTVVSAGSLTGYITIERTDGEKSLNSRASYFEVTCDTGADCSVSGCCKSGLCRESSLCPILPGEGEECDNDLDAPGCQFGDCQAGLTCNSSCICEAIPGVGENCDANDNEADGCQLGACAEGLTCDGASGCTCQPIDYVRPKISMVSPSSGGPGMQIAITGFNFGNEKGNVLFGGEIDAANRDSWNWTPTIISNIYVPDLSLGSYDLKVQTTAGFLSDSVNFIISSELPQVPTIEKINPSSGPIGEYITIKGINFGEVAGTVQFFDDLDGDGTDWEAADIDFPDACGDNYWFENQIIVKVPENLNTIESQVRLLNSGGIESNYIDFTITSNDPNPGICRLDPVSGPAGTEVSFYGERFGNYDQENSEVNFSVNSVAQVTEDNWEDEAVENAVVADTASTGPVSLTNEDELVSNQVEFSVADCRELGSECGIGYECCYDGTCRTSCPTAGLIKPSYFYYTFRTGNIVEARIPQVIETESCDNDTQSPSPYKGATDVCQNAVITARFNTDMDPATLNNPNNIKVYQCVGDLEEEDPVQACNVNGSEVTGAFMASQMIKPVDFVKDSFTTVLYNFEGSGGTENDLSDNNNDATLLNVSREEVEGYEVATFNGASSTMITSDDPTLESESIVIEAWIRLNETPTENVMIVSKMADLNSGYSFGITSNRRLFTRIGLGNSNIYQTDDSAINLDEWYYVAMIFNKENNFLKLFKNGVEVSSLPLTGDQSINYTQSEDLYIGSSADIYGYFSGSIAELRISNFGRDIAQLVPYRSFTFIPDDNYQANVWYRVVILDNVTSITNTPLDGDRDNRPGGDYAWNFKTKEGICEIEKVVVSPPTASVTQTDRNIFYEALPVAEQCYILNPLDYDWSWDSRIRGGTLNSGFSIATISALTNAGDTKVDPWQWASSVGQGITYIRASTEGKVDNDNKLDVNLLAPVIELAHPTDGLLTDGINSYVTFYGYNFGQPENDSYVSFGQAKARLAYCEDSWNENRVIAQVPLAQDIVTEGYQYFNLAEPSGENLIAFYNFDERPQDYNNLFDQTVNNYNGDIVNGDSTERLDGVVDGSIRFDGQNSYASLPITTIKNNEQVKAEYLNLEEGAVSFWVNANNFNNIGTIVSFSEGSDKNYFSIGINNLGNLYFEIVKGDGVSSGRTLSDALNTNTWYHVAVNIGENGTSGYINGVNIYNHPNTDFISDLQNINYLTLAAQNKNASFDNYFDGQIDNLAFFDKPLTSNEVLKLMGANIGEGGLVGLYQFEEGSENVSDSSGNGLTAVASSPEGLTIETSGRFGQAIKFDGSSYLTLENSNRVHFDNAATLMAWFKAENNGQARMIVSKGNNEMQLAMTNENKLRFLINGNRGQRFAQSPTVLTDNDKWHLVAGTYDGRIIKLFLDGNEVSSYGNDDDPLNLINRTLESIRIGANNSGELVWDNLLDSVAIYNRVLLAEDIKTLYGAADEDEISITTQYGTDIYTDLFKTSDNVYPMVCNITPNFGSEGDQITISGDNFGDTIANSQISFDNDLTNFYGGMLSGVVLNNEAIVGWSNQSINLNIPVDNDDNPDNGVLENYNYLFDEDITNDNRFAVVTTRYSINNENKILDSNPESFDLLPIITSITPDNGPENQFVTISGQNFGSVPGEVHFSPDYVITQNEDGSFNVEHGGSFYTYQLPVPCQGSWWQDDQIVVQTPVGGLTGSVYIQTAYQLTSNAVEFEYNDNPLTPGICLVDPNQGQPNNPDFPLNVDVVGVNLNEQSEINGQVIFNREQESQIISWSQEQVLVYAPEQTMTGPVVVRHNIVVQGECDGFHIGGWCPGGVYLEEIVSIDSNPLKFTVIPDCGNGVIDVDKGEMCDGKNFPENFCENFPLACQMGCTNECQLPPVFCDNDGILEQDYLTDDANFNGYYDDGEYYKEGPEEFVDSNGNGLYDFGEPFSDLNGDNRYNFAEDFDDVNNNFKYDSGEDFTDTNGNSVFDAGEDFIDDNGNGRYDPAEPFQDKNSNGVFDPLEKYTDINRNGSYDNGESYSDIMGFSSITEADNHYSIEDSQYNFEYCDWSDMPTGMSCQSFAEYLSLKEFTPDQRTLALYHFDQSSESGEIEDSKGEYYGLLENGAYITSAGKFNQAVEFGPPQLEETLSVSGADVISDPGADEYEFNQDYFGITIPYYQGSLGATGVYQFDLASAGNYYLEIDASVKDDLSETTKKSIITNNIQNLTYCRTGSGTLCTAATPEADRYFNDDVKALIQKGIITPEDLANPFKYSSSLLEKELYQAIGNKIYFDIYIDNVIKSNYLVIEGTSRQLEGVPVGNLNLGNNSVQFDVLFDEGMELGLRLFNLSLVKIGTNSQKVAITGNPLENVGSYSIESWIYPESYPVSGTSTIFSDIYGAAGLSLGLTLSGKLELKYYDDSSNLLNILSNRTIGLDKWTKIGLVYDQGAQTIELFINGVADKSLNNESIKASLAENVLIGAELSNNNILHGRIDDLIISAGLSEITGNVTGYLSCNMCMLDLSTCGFETGGVDQGAVAYEQCFDGNLPIDSEGLRGFWPMENGEARDFTGNNNHGTVINGNQDTGIAGDSVHFDGSAYVKVPHAEAIDPSGGFDEFSISLWFKRSEKTPWARLISKGYFDGSADQIVYYADIQDNPLDKIKFALNIDGTVRIVTSNYTVENNEWTNLIMTYDGDKMRLYINGNLDSTSDSYAGQIVQRPDFDLGIGASIRPDGTHQNTFKGNIDEVLIFGRALTDEEISEYFGSTKQCVDITTCIEDTDCDDCGAGVTNCIDNVCQPVITNFGPKSGEVGTLVSLQGCYFGDNPGQVIFTDNKQGILDISATCGDGLDSWTDQEILVEVPDKENPDQNAVTGPIGVITAYGGNAQTASDFNINNIVHPVMCSLNPNMGFQGTPVEILGENFGTVFTEGEDNVSFSNIDLAQSSSFSQWSDESINLRVPNGTETGNVILYKNNIDSNPLKFTVPMCKGLVNYWKFDQSDGIFALDTKGNNNLELSGTQNWLPTQGYDGVFDFNGTDNYFVSEDVTMPDDNKDDYSFTAWVKPATNQWGPILNFANKNSNTNSFSGLWQNASGKLFFYVKNDAGENIVDGSNLISPDSLVTTSGHHIAGVKQGNVYKIYHNGSLVGTYEATINGDFTREIFSVGARVSQSTASYYDGLIDEVTLWDRALTDQEVMNLVTNTPATYCSLGYCGDGSLNNIEECDDSNTQSNDDCSSICKEEEFSYECDEGIIHAWRFDDGDGRDYNGSANADVIGNVVWSEQGKVGGAMVFSGEDNSYLKTADTVNIGERGTIEFWMKRTDLSLEENQGLVTIANDQTPYLAGDNKLKLHNTTSGYLGTGDSGLIVDSNWHYVTITYKNEQYSVYLDGEKIKGPNNFANQATSGQIAIGAYSGGNKPFAGLIDEVVVYNRNLSDKEVLSHYSKSNKGNQYCEKVVTYECTDNMVSLWRFDSNASDSVGSNNGTVYNSNFVSGQVSGAIDFNGLNDYVEVKNSNSLNITKAITIEGWIYPRSIPTIGDERLLTKTDGSSYGVQYQLFIRDKKPQLSFYTFDQVQGQDAWIGAFSSNEIQNNIWTHIAFTYDGQVVRVYLNGQLDNQLEFVGSLRSNAGNLYIGYDPRLDDYFDGSLDEFTIYNRALSDGEILSHYQNSSARASYCYFDCASGMVSLWSFDDQSANDVFNNNNGVVNGASWNEQSKVGGGYQFNGTSDYINVSNNILNNEQTIAFWVKPEDNSGANTVVSALGSESGLFKGFRIDAKAGLNAYIYNNVSNLIDAISMSSPISTGEWYHVALTISQRNSLTKLFINGEEKAAESFSAFGSVNTDMDFGRYNLYDNIFYKGELDEVVLYNRALSNYEISNIYNNSAKNKDYCQGLRILRTSPEDGQDNICRNGLIEVEFNDYIDESSVESLYSRPGIVFDQSCKQEVESSMAAYWNFDQGSGDILADQTGNGKDGTIHGATWSNDQKIFGNSLYFDGVNDYVEIPTSSNDDVLAIDGDLTLEFWAYPENTGRTQALIAKNYVFDYELDVAPSTNLLRFLHGYGSGSSEHEAVSVEGAKINLNQWNHVAISRDSNSQQINFYVNGEYVGSNNYDLVPTVRNDNFFIGSRRGDVTFYKGYLDEMVVYNRVLSSTEIANDFENNCVQSEKNVTLYQCIGETTVKEGVLNRIFVYIKNLVLSIFNQKAIAQADPECSNQAPIQTRFSFNKSGTGTTLGITPVNPNNTEEIVNLSPGQKYKVLIKGGSSGVQSNSGGDLYNDYSFYFSTPEETLGSDPNLVSLLNFDNTPIVNGSVIVDNSGNGNNGTFVSDNLNDNKTRDNGVLNKALYFDGVSDSARFGSGGDFNITEQITLIGWVNPESFDTGSDLTTVAAKSGSYYLELDKDGKVAVYQYGTNLNPGEFVKSNNSIFPNVWQQIAYTYDGSQIDIYINGQLDRTVQNLGGSIATSNNQFAVGANTITPERYFNGLIDEVLLYSRALSAGEIAQIYSDKTVEAQVGGICEADELRVNIEIGPLGSGNIILENDSNYIEDAFFCAQNNCDSDMTNSINGNQHLYSAKAYYQGQPVAAEYWWQRNDISDPDNLFSLEYSEDSDDNLEVVRNEIGKTYVTASGGDGNGKITVEAKANGSDNIVSQTINSRVFICENPWPAPETKFPAIGNRYNFETYYCADDLPAADIVEPIR